VHADSRGRLEASRGLAGLCAVELEQVDS